MLSPVLVLADRLTLAGRMLTLKGLVLLVLERFRDMGRDSLDPDRVELSGTMPRPSPPLNIDLDSSVDNSLSSSLPLLRAFRRGLFEDVLEESQSSLSTEKILAVVSCSIKEVRVSRILDEDTVRVSTGNGLRPCRED